MLSSLNAFVDFAKFKKVYGQSHLKQKKITRLANFQVSSSRTSDCSCKSYATVSEDSDCERQWWSMRKLYFEVFQRK